MKRISTFVDKEDYEWLRMVSKSHDRPIAELIRRAIRGYRLREGQELGEAYVPINLSSPECEPSTDENKIKGIRERLEKLEKFVLDEVSKAHDLMSPTSIFSDPYLPDYMKKHLQ